MAERNLTGADDGARTELHEMVDALNRADLSSSQGKELQEKILSALQGIQEKLDNNGRGERRGEFDVRDVDISTATDQLVAKQMLETRLKELPESNDMTSRLYHQMNDEMYLMGQILKTENPWLETKRGRDHVKTMVKLGLARDMKDFSTGASSGSPYIPTGFSATLHEQVRLQFRVAALHERITMPTDPYKLPIEGLDATAYLVSEQGNSDANLSAGNLVTPSYSGSATPSLTNLTLTSVKLGSRVTFSSEVAEDSIIPILPYVNRKIVLAMADAQEDATINGDTAGTHQDSDVTSGADARKAWMGYRKLAPGAARVDLNGSTGITTTIDVKNLRDVRLTMGKYGLDPNKLAFVTGPTGFIKLLSLKDGANPSPIQTLDKFGPNAVILTGQLGAVDGIPIIVSSKVREDMGSTTSGVTGTTVDRTMILLVNRDAVVYGDRRQATVKSRDIIETDQTILVILQRLTMGAWFPGQPLTSYLYNIKK